MTLLSVAPLQVEEAAMRLLLFMLGILIGTAWLGTRAEAQNYPWCAEYMGFEGGGTNCGFVSFDQCMMTARGAGAFCVRNTQYHPTGPAPHPLAKSHKRLSG